MRIIHRAMRGGAVALALASLPLLGACANAGGLGSVLGSVLGGGQQGNQVSGTVLGVDTRYQQISLQQSNGQSIALSYDNNTRVTYQNQNYAVTSLDRGDQVTARVQSTTNNSYYTDLVQVDRPVNGSPAGGMGSQQENVQSLQGTVRQVDRTNGWFTMDTGNYGTVTVTLPYNPSSATLNTFNNLRAGNGVRLYGVFVNNTRVELRQFY